jgi:hypothetical protein
MTTHKSNTTVHIVIPKTFLADVDKEARACYMSRSDFVRVALMEKMGKKSLVEFEWPVWEPPKDEPDDDLTDLTEEDLVQ